MYGWPKTIGRQVCTGMIKFMILNTNLVRLVQYLPDTIMILTSVHLLVHTWMSLWPVMHELCWLLN